MRALVLPAWLCVCLAWPGAARALEAVDDFGSNPGGLRMWRHVPAGLGEPAPLVVLLHGCGQTAADYDDEVGWLELADRWGFALVLAEQRAINNASMCFRWFEAAHTARDQGEALSIRQMVSRMAADLPIDGDRVFVSGLSSGGAMALVMLAAYPDVFAAGGVVAGLPFGCARSVWEASGCMQGLRDLSPEAWAALARDASGLPGPWPRLSVWSGERDRTVDPANAREIVEQWSALLGLEPTAVEEGPLGVHRRRVWREDGRVVLEAIALTDAEHGQPVLAEADPPCGRPGPYRLELGVCAARELALFFGLEPDGADGFDGSEESDGSDGSDGSEESDGSDGSEESDGSDGSEESDGSDESNGADGSDTVLAAGQGCGCTTPGPGAFGLAMLLGLLLLRARRVPGV